MSRVHWPTLRDNLGGGLLGHTLADVARNAKVQAEVARQADVMPPPGS